MRTRPKLAHPYIAITPLGHPTEPTATTFSWLACKLMIRCHCWVKISGATDSYHCAYCECCTLYWWIHKLTVCILTCILGSCVYWHFNSRLFCRNVVGANSCDDNLLQSYCYANASICTVWYHEENMNECPNNDQWMNVLWPMAIGKWPTNNNVPGSIRVCEDRDCSMQSLTNQCSHRYQWPFNAVMAINDHSIRSWVSF